MDTQRKKHAKFCLERSGKAFGRTWHLGQNTNINSFPGKVECCRKENSGQNTIYSNARKAGVPDG